MGVTKQDLNGQKRSAGLIQVGGKAMPQGMDTGVLLDAGCYNSFVKGILNSLTGHWLIRWNSRDKVRSFRTIKFPVFSECI